MSLVLLSQSHHHTQGRCWSSRCSRSPCSEARACVVASTLVVSSAVSSALFLSDGLRLHHVGARGGVWLGGSVCLLFFLNSLLSCFSPKFFVSVSSTGKLLTGDRGMDVWGPPGVRVQSRPWGLYVLCAGLWRQGASLLKSRHIPLFPEQCTLCPPLTGEPSEDPLIQLLQRSPGSPGG